jgi:NADPH:quinone reductase-like Zn-dependent oxidoreductase
MFTIRSLILILALYTIGSSPFQLSTHHIIHTMGNQVSIAEQGTMNAIELINATTPSNGIQCQKPTPSADQVLVRVSTCSIDTQVDTVLNQKMAGYFLHSRTRPLILGWHFVGSVAALGTNVKDFKIGDRVWGILKYSPKQKQGTFAEYIVTGSNECCLLPSQVSDHTAAACSTELLTALQAVRDKGGFSTGKRLLVIGGGGGVESAAVAIGKRLGAHVIAICSAHHMSLVQKLGADRVIDRRDFRWDDDRETKYDVIFDTPNVYSFSECQHALNPGGTYVATLPSLDMVLAPLRHLFTSKRYALVNVESKRADLDLLGQWLVQGMPTRAVDSHFPISEIDKALARYRDPSRAGPVVLNVADGWAH